MNCYTKSKGFSLVELLVALTLFGLMAAGLASLAIQSRRMSETIIFEDQVHRSIQNFLEEIRGIGYERIENVLEAPKDGFDLTLPDIDGAGAIVSVNIPIAVVNDTERLPNWTTINVETTTKDGDSTTLPIELRVALNSHKVLASENTEGIEVIIQFQWQLPWEKDGQKQLGEAIAFVADESP